MLRKLNKCGEYVRWPVIYLAILVAGCSQAQPPYTTDLFPSTVTEVDTEYGISMGFDGIMDTLKLDVYKPVSDANCLRPLLIFVHGGGWIAGDKAGGQVPTVCNALAARGWVVASINYRMGMHPTASYTPYALCQPSPFDVCIRATDTTEFYRANYRAMQDAKGAIRYMKGRASVDSTDINNTFIAGESAGGFIAMLTAFMDSPSEKPAQCLSQPDAPMLDADLAHCVALNADRSRPDLGPVDGTLHLGSVDASLKGVGSFYAGLFDTSIVQGPDTPAVYMFHQTNDIIAPSGRRRLLSSLGNQCLSGICEPFYQTPFSHGSGWLRTWWQSSTSAPNFSADIINNWTGTILDCTANGHSIDAPALRVTHMAELFSPLITTSGNNPSTNCMTVGVDQEHPLNRIGVLPNPGIGNVFYVTGDLPLRALALFNMAGMELESQMIVEGPARYRIELMNDAHGIMLVRATDNRGDVQMVRLVIL